MNKQKKAVKTTVVAVWTVIVTLLAAGVYLACDNNPADPGGEQEREPRGGPEVVPEETYGVDVEMEYGSDARQSGTVINIIQTQGLVIGRGYHFTKSPYFNPSHLKNDPVFDMVKLGEDSHLYEDSKMSTGTKWTTFVGTNLTEYSQSICAKVEVSVNPGAFSAKVNTEFGFQETQSYEKSFATILGDIKRKKQYLSNSATNKDLREKYIDATFRDNYLLNTGVTPEDLFDKYGTHIMLDAYLGGRIEVRYLYTNSNNESAYNIKAAVEGAYGPVEAKVEFGYEEKVKHVKQNSEVSVETFGGTTTGMRNLDEAETKLNDWATTINANDKITFMKSERVMAIWELIEENGPHQNRRKALENYFDTLLARNGSWLKSLQPNTEFPQKYIKNIFMGANTPWNAAVADLMSTAADEDSYAEVIPVKSHQGWANLNSRTGTGNNVSIGYTTTTNTDSAITNIQAEWGGNNTVPHRWSYTSGGCTYNLFGVNGNSGTWTGANIWLYATRCPSAGKPLKHLYAEYNGNLGGRDGSGWTRVKWGPEVSNKKWANEDANMNDGTASGDNIWLWMQR